MIRTATSDVVVQTTKVVPSASQCAPALSIDAHVYKKRASKVEVGRGACVAARMRKTFEDIASVEVTSGDVYCVVGRRHGPNVILRERWNFSPRGSNRESEDCRVELRQVRSLELTITSDISDRTALPRWRVCASRSYY